METGRVYTINKGINKPLEFKGLKAQYVLYVAGGVVGMLAFYGVLHLSGFNDYVGLVLTLGVGTILIARVYRMSRRFGQHGLMKRKARKMMPQAILSKSRKLFTQLSTDHVRDI
jgi:hypothetical protein